MREGESPLPGQQASPACEAIAAAEEEEDEEKEEERRDREKKWGGDKTKYEICR